MQINTRQKRKLMLGLVMTILLLFVFPLMGMDFTPVAKASLLGTVWLAVAAAFWYWRDR